MIAYLLYKLGSLATRCLPLAFLYRLAAFLARCHLILDRRARRAVLANLAQVCGDASPPGGLEPMAFEVFRHFSANVVDFLRLPGLTPEQALGMIEVEGWEHVEAAVARGRGVIVFSAHFGNWEWGAVLLSARGLTVHAVALDHGSPRVTRMFAAHRACHGVRTLPAHGSGFAIIRALNRGEVVCLVTDREFTGQGVEAEFFGKTTVVPRGPASIALRTGAALVPAFMVRTGPSAFRAVLLPAVESEDLPESRRTDMLVERYLRVIENQIRARPEQWCVFVPIWGMREATPS